jgi:hypothetical protein
MVKGDKLDYFGFSGYTNEQLKQMGYVLWLPVQEKGSWLGEGDNHTFMNMLGNGLQAYEAGSYGGWGGRQVANYASNDISFQLSDTSAQAMAAMLGSLNNPVNQSGDVQAYPNFFPAAQRDFAARLKWSVTPNYFGANHAPRIKIEGPLHIVVTAGEKIRVNGATSDPDNDEVSVRWWQFHVGSYPNQVTISNATSLRTEVLIPNGAMVGQTIHLVLEATDNGKPALTSYKRVIITVRNK